VFDKLIGYLRHQTTTGVQLGELDAFRGWACLGVVFIHCIGNLGSDTPTGAAGSAVIWFLQQGGHGVDLFFFISGFLLFIKFGKAYYEGMPSPSVKAFYKRRFFRIAPAYYVNVALVMALWSLHYTHYYYFRWDARDILAHVTFLHNMSPTYSQSINPVLWTLAIEMQFYLVLPFIASWFYGRRWLIGATAILLASSAYKIWVIQMDASSGSQGINLALTPFNQLLWRLDQFAIGMCFANLWLYVTLREERPAFLTSRGFAGLLVVLGVCTVLGAFRLEMHYLDTYPMLAVISSPLASVGFGMLVFGTIYSGIIKDIIANRSIELVGIVSYSVYLWYYQVVVNLGLLFPWFDEPGYGSFLIRVALALPLSVAVGLLSYMAVERPFLKGKGIKQMLSPAPDQAQGVAP